MADAGRVLVAKIRTAAKASDNPGLVYEQAGIAAPKPRERAPVPAAPTDLSAEINTEGAVTLRWKARVTGRTYYEVQRSVTMPGEVPGAFATVSSGAEKDFTDLTAPAGAARLDYRVRAGNTTGVGAYSAPHGVVLTPAPVAPPQLSLRTVVGREAA